MLNFIRVLQVRVSNIQLRRINRFPRHLSKL